MRSIKPNDSDKETMKMEKRGIQGRGSTSDQTEGKGWEVRGRRMGEALNVRGAMHHYRCVTTGTGAATAVCPEGLLDFLSYSLYLDMTTFEKKFI